MADLSCRPKFSIGALASALAAALLVLPASANAELRVRLKLEHTALLQYEPLNAVISIFNDSDYRFVTGKDEKSNNARIEFVAQKSRDEFAPRLAKGPAVKLNIPPGEKGEAIVDLSSRFDMRAMGKYTIYAVAYLNGKGWESNREIVDVVRGIEIASATRSIRGYEDARRVYSLRYWGREKKEFLFLCVDEEPTGVNYGVIQLGPIVRVFTPTIDVDRQGNVKILHQSGSDCYTRSLFKSDSTGIHFVDQTFHTEKGDPYPFKEKKGQEDIPPPVSKKKSK